METYWRDIGDYKWHGDHVSVPQDKWYIWSHTNRTNKWKHTLNTLFVVRKTQGITLYITVHSKATITAKIRQSTAIEVKLTCVFWCEIRHPQYL